MNDPFVTRELEIQSTADAAAYKRLSRPKRKLAAFLASIGFTGRQRLVGGSAWIVGGLEAVLYFLFIWPYIALSRFAAWSAESAVKMAIVVVDATFGLAARLLAAANAALSFLIRVVELRLVGTASGRLLRALLGGLEALRRSTVLLARNVTIWRFASARLIESQWRQTKALITTLLSLCYRAFEYYGPIALYRSVKWILNPRRRSGGPLLGDERVNSFFGLFMAALGFAGFTVLLIGVGVWAKIMHAELALAFATDSGPVGLRIAKQILFQPLITIGLTAAKVILLPIIAATRQRLKSVDLSRGIAFAYNRRLNRRKRQDQACNPESAGMKRIIFPALSVFVEHLIEKSAPTFYEGRLRWHQSHGQAAGAAGTASQERRAIGRNPGQ